jgi:predicted NBD/HSP70 family sugar kinase
VRLKANLQLMKEMNLATVLHLIHREGRLTRAELTKRTGFSPATVSALVEELIGSGYVQEVGEKPSAGAGRKAISLQIDKNGGCVAGVALGKAEMVCTVLNLYGEPVAEYRTPYRPNDEPLAQQVQAAIKSCMQRVETVNPARLKGIGVSVPGIVDENGKTVLFSSTLRLAGLKLGEAVEAGFPGVPVRIVNDANAAAFAEHYSGAGKDKESLIYFTIHEGVGAGIIVRSQVHSGFRGGAGELGHLVVDPQGERCNCGQRGCLETVLTRPYILAECQRKAVEQGVQAPGDFEELLVRYERGEPWLEPIFERILHETLRMIAVSVSLASPEVVVLAGWLNRSAKLTSRLREALDASPFPLRFTSDRVLTAKYGEQAALRGAATLMLHDLFRAPDLGGPGGYSNGEK